MQLSLPAPPSRYKSPTQRIRHSSEEWAASELYCPNCSADALDPTPRGTEAIDYTCPNCPEQFQLKSQSHPLGRKLMDAAFHAMKRKIETEIAPNLVGLHYLRNLWRVHTVMLVPSFVFTLSLLEKRRPLGPKARRAGWIGCNILLGNVPPDARIFLVREGEAIPKHLVRKGYKRLRPLRQLSLEKRGWTLDVLNAIRAIGRREFSLAEAYGFESSLAALHPNNRHVRDKIRQQLQVLRDLGFVRFLGRGCYRLP